MPWIPLLNGTTEFLSILWPYWYWFHNMFSCLWMWNILQKYWDLNEKAVIDNQLSSFTAMVIITAELAVLHKPNSLSTCSSPELAMRWHVGPIYYQTIEMHLLSDESMASFNFLHIMCKCQWHHYCHQVDPLEV